ncbi:hypothetical protein OHA72_46770 [Dactylosporangium sp. NBC_01737]|uniref:hypothetical protein n=1 Tax=Dactylosporangium sp. NBC_01737 TaxID=2975959 RepID=UPI002E1416CF|nr:hypothetical protein OHA72_46770 [Dactylosporangium sp. NBC_01737]
MDALFAVHLVKENDLVLPLPVSAPHVSPAEILAGMHELLGADDVSAAPSAPAGVLRMADDGEDPERGLSSGSTTSQGTRRGQYSPARPQNSPTPPRTPPNVRQG